MNNSNNYSKLGEGKLPYFPSPYPGEHLYSLISRYARYSQIPSSVIRQEVFGDRRYGMRLDAPIQLKRLSSMMEQERLSDPLFLLRELTPFNYMTAYMGDIERKIITDGMMNCNRPNKARGVKFGQTLRYCTCCFMDDILDPSIGEPYWRVLHQLPSVMVCSLHGVLLSYSEVVVAGDSTQFLVPFHNRPKTLISDPPQDKISADALSILKEMAENSQRLLFDFATSGSSAAFRNDPFKVAEDLGLTWRRGCNSVVMAVSFKDVMAPVLSLFPELVATDGYPSWWLSAFIRGDAKLRRHTFLWVVIETWMARAAEMPALDGRVGSLRVSRSMSAGRGTSQVKNKEKRDEIMSDKVRDVADKILMQAPPVRITRNRIAKICGISTLARAKHADIYWPKSSLIINSIVEDESQYLRRKIFYKLNILSKAKSKVSYGDVISSLGYRKVPDHVRELVYEALSKYVDNRH